MRIKGEAPFFAGSCTRQAITKTTCAFNLRTEPQATRFDHALLPLSPRTRKRWSTDKWTGYEVVLDLWPDVNVGLRLDRNLATLARRASEGIAQSRCASLACASG
jgi:hypothetical protein